MILIHQYRNLSGSEEDDVEQELGLDDYPDTTATSISPLNSSLDDPDGNSIHYTYSKTKRNIELYPDGKVKALTETRTKKNIAVSKKEESNNRGMWPIVIIAITSLAVFCYMIYNRNVVAVPRTGQQFRCSFELSEREFPNQNKILWKSLEHGVESVLNDIPTSPSIFLLAYEDVKSVNKITRSIVERTTECMNSKVNALELSPADLAYDEMKTDYGVVITKYKNQLRKSGVMLVNDLNKVKFASCLIAKITK